MQQYETILYEPGTVARVILNRPAVLNAQNLLMLRELNDALHRASYDSEVRVIVLSANGRAFSAGHDVKEMNTPEWEKGRNSQEVWRAFERTRVTYAENHLAWRNIPKPTLALVHGKVKIGGLMLMWPCDLIVCSEDAEFLDHSVAMGVGGAEFFAHPWEMGIRKAKEFLFTADWIKAAEAHRLGMVNHVVPRAELESFGLAMAERIAQKPLFALKLVKQAINAAQDAQGRVGAMQTSFALHHLAHAHNMLAHGKLVDPTGLMPAIKKHEKAS